MEEIESQLVQEALRLPNKTHVDTPIGGEDKNILVAESEIKPDMTKKMSHLDIAAKHDMLDFANASKLTGSKFVFMKNEIALLELALVNWTMNFLAMKGFTPLLTPDIARQ
jgi:seryl-tRNA synthetase